MVNREEAIKILKDLKDVDNSTPIPNKLFYEAFDMAIEALSTEYIVGKNGGDLISRADAIEEVCGDCPIELRDKCKTEEDYCDFVKYLLSVPSVSAEPKSGHWVWNKDGMDWGLGAWVCSECGRKPETWWEADPNHNPLRCSGSHYCGNCGAKMEGN